MWQRKHVAGALLGALLVLFVTGGVQAQGNIQLSPDVLTVPFIPENGQLSLSLISGDSGTNRFVFELALADFGPGLGSSAVYIRSTAASISSATVVDSGNFSNLTTLIQVPERVDVAVVTDTSSAVAVLEIQFQGTPTHIEFFNLHGDSVTATVTLSSIFRAIDLGTLGGAYSFARDINNAGRIVGWSTTASGETHAFLWENGAMIDLGTLGGTSSEAFFINENGQVAGISTTPSGEGHAFLWENGVMTDLGHLGGNLSHALDLNDAGQVVGVSRTATSGAWFRGFLWENGAMSNIGTLGGITNTWAYDINEVRQIAGESSTLIGTFEPRAFIWENGLMTNLGTLGGNYSSARALNGARQVVGSSRTAGGQRHAFLWENGVMTDLLTLGGTDSQAWAINEAGQIIGHSVTAAGGDPHGFFWENGVMTDLRTLGGAWSHPTDINEAGQVVGSSRTTGNGPTHAFLWENGFLMDLGTLGGTGTPSGSGSVASALNEMNQIVGQANTAAEVAHATLWRLLTPVETIETIISAVEGLNDDGIVNRGQAKSLINRLNLVTAMLNDGKTTAAGHLLESFIMEVQAFVNAGVLTAEQGQPLIDTAQKLIDSLP